MQKTIPSKLKATVALEAIRGVKTTNQLSSQYDVHPVQIGIWKKIVQDRSLELFTQARKQEEEEKNALIDRLYKIIGQRDMELEWVKKKLHLEP